MCLEKREGGPLYRNQKRGKSHIKPMWDSYLTKSNTDLYDKISIEDEEESGLVVDQGQGERVSAGEVEVALGWKILDRQSDQLPGDEGYSIENMETGKGCFH